MLVANKTFTKMDSPNLMIVEVTESPKEGSKAGMKHDEQHQQDQQEKKEGLKAAEKSVVSSTKPELGETAGSTYIPDQPIQMGCTYIQVRTQ